MELVMLSMTFIAVLPHSWINFWYLTTIYIILQVFCLHEDINLGLLNVVTIVTKHMAQWCLFQLSCDGVSTPGFSYQNLVVNKESSSMMSLRSKHWPYVTRNYNEHRKAEEKQTERGVFILPLRILWNGFNIYQIIASPFFTTVTGYSGFKKTIQIKVL